MRGRETASVTLFSYVCLEERVPSDHPLRPIRALADAVLAGLNARFEGLYSDLARPSIPPEMLLRATLLQAFFSVRSERMLMEQTDYNLLFRWPHPELVEGHWAGDRCAGLAPDGVHPQSRPALGGGSPRLPVGAAGAQAGQAASVERPLLGRRHDDRGLGLDEEGPAQGRLGRVAGAGPQRRARLPQGDALERDACLDYRPGARASTARRTAGRAGCATSATR